MNYDGSPSESILEHGDFLDLKEIYDGTNRVFEVLVGSPNENIRAIYKPMSGEAPLYDFPSGTLYQREQASYLVSDVLSWHIVPLTTIRVGPYGIGSLQQYIDHDSDATYITLKADNIHRFKQIAVFDIITNNADRKGNHFLIDQNRKIWGIDHGLTFNEQYKLRTVVWDFIGDSIPKSIIKDLAKLHELMNTSDQLSGHLAKLINNEEVEAFKERISAVAEFKNFPFPGSGRNVPWPPF
tara:strand:+ start:10818 stop:11537 length:720 start_codon:yes stop_codon:yes gene_type:complete